MMNMKVIGLVLIAIMTTILLLQLETQEETESGELLLPALRQSLSEVTGLTIRSGDRTIKIERSGDRFTLSEKSNYPVDFRYLSTFLNQLSELEIAERKTSKPENHDRLGVADAGEGAGVQVAISTADQSFELIIGRAAESRGSFIRLTGNPQVYLADQLIDVPLIPFEWLDPVVINVESSDVQQVEITTQAGDVLQAIRGEESGVMELQGMPPGANLKYETVVDNLARLLVNLRMQDVRPFDPATFDAPSVTRLTLLSGESIEAKTVRLDEAYWLHLNREDNALWQYRISEYSFNELNKTINDLLEEDDNE
jgi:hypothetical protein